MSTPMWKKMDAVEAPPWHLLPEDLQVCYFARDYVSHGGFKASEANGLITNLKKPISTRGTNQWYYKEQAITKFATELADWLGSGDDEFHIAQIPSSKRRDDPEYDPRLDMVLQRFCVRCPKAKFANPIDRKVTKQAAHVSDSRPSIEQIQESLEWKGLQTPPDAILLIDDVITTGASFRACKRLFAENAPGVQVFGIFWARTVWPEPSLEVDLSGLGL